MVAARDRRRGDDQVARQVQGHARRADRSAQDDRGAGAAAASRPPSRSTGSRAACTRPRPAAPRCCIELAVPARSSRRRRSSRTSATTSSRSSRRCIEVDGREKQVDTYYFNKKRAQGDARLPLMYWGKYVAHDNNRDGMGQFLKLTQHVTQDVPRVEADDPARPARGADLPLRVDRHRALQRRARSDHGQRVVDAGQERRDGDDQARRARRVDLRVLRRLGAELHVLHRARAQRDRPLLRSAELRPRHRTRCARARRRRAASGSARTRRCRRSSGARATTRTSSSRRCSSRSATSAKNQRAVPRELLAQEQARGRQGQERADVRVGDSGRASAARPTRPTP